MIPLSSDNVEPTPLENPSKPAEKPTQQNHHHEQDGDHRSQDLKHERHGHDGDGHTTIMMKTMIMVLMPIVSSVKMRQALLCHTVIIIITSSRRI